MAAVDRLTEMGFDRADAAQAFLACDKNEALAANLLMDSAGQEGGVFGFHNLGQASRAHRVAEWYGGHVGILADPAALRRIK